jgi:quercetin dioxygenase-like cupin family protein
MKFSPWGVTLSAALMSISISTAISATSPTAAHRAESMDQATFLNLSDLRWQKAPPSLPQGMEMTVLHGDPGKPGPFAIRFRTPGDYKIPPHFHSKAETLTVLSGRLYLGGGEQFDPTKAHVLEVGAFHYLPAKTPHFAFTKAPAVVEVHGEGPFDIVYIKPEDDPRKARGKE